MNIQQRIYEVTHSSYENRIIPRNLEISFPARQSLFDKYRQGSIRLNPSTKFSCVSYAFTAITHGSINLSCEKLETRRRYDRDTKFSNRPLLLIKDHI